MKATRWLTIGIAALMTMFWHSPAHAAFVDNRNGTVSDTVTGLMWQKGDSQNDSAGRTWEEALNYCECLTLPSGGYSDWRLPNVRELETLVDWDRYDPAIDPLFSCRSGYYWSSSTRADYPDYAWLVYFYGGDVDDGFGKRHYYCVRCVRGGPSGSFGNLDHFVISTISSPQAVGVAFPVTITAKDAGGNMVTGFNGQVWLRSSLGKVSPTYVNLASGQATASVTIGYPGNIGLTCTGYGVYGWSNFFHVGGDCAGKIYGKVVDAKRDPVAQATVTLYDYQDQSAGQVQTDSSGNYSFTSVDCGTYRISAEKDGKSAGATGIYVADGMALKVSDMMLQINGGAGATPVILVPGMMGSTLPNLGPYPLVCSTRPCKNLVLWDWQDKAGWGQLEELLTDAGLKVFRCAWDWRTKCEDVWKVYLKDVIDEALEYSTTGKVHIVAHSMGGLVVRAYIQGKDYGARKDIGKVAFVGTPHQGSCTPYYIWEGGNPKAADDITDKVLLSVVNAYTSTLTLLWARYNPMAFGLVLLPKPTRAFVRDMVPSLRQLLYTEAFLLDKDGTTGNAWDVDSPDNKNSWLDDLNDGDDPYNPPEQVMSADGANDTVQVMVFAGKSDDSTIRWVKTEGKDTANDLYEDGIPTSPLEKSAKMEDGDGTVPYRSAVWPQEDSWAALGGSGSGEHISLVKVYKTQIRDFLLGASGAAALGETASADSPTSAFSVSVTGDMRVLVTSPGGTKTGVDPTTGAPVETIPSSTCAFYAEDGGVTVENAAAGTYTVTYFGERNQDFRLNVGYSDDSKTETYSYQGFRPAAARTFSVAVNPTGTPRLTITPPAKAPTNL